MNTNHNKLRFLRSLSLSRVMVLFLKIVTFRTPKDIYFSLYHCNTAMVHEPRARCKSAYYRLVTSRRVRVCVCVCVYLPYITHIFHTERALARA